MSAVVNMRDNPVDSAATSDANLALRLQAGVTALGLSLSQQQQQQLLDYIVLLDKWNKVYNLTAVREPERMLGLHILDSLSMVPHLGQAKTVLDVGTGGGLPGICIAVARPDLNVVMLDSLQKKTTFVRQAIGALGLTNASVVCERVEAFRPAQPFDVVTSRAFAELSDFVKGAGHLMRPGGRMLAMKGVYPHDEIARAFSSPEASHKVVDVHTLNVPQVDGQRHLVVIEAKTI
ncbi:MAG: 16S rRNA (guanine(527)-N(7))-methyltransferase RsmG [Burkholderiales bacterium]|jgi:16S rRNA (guanine527-N7)-methyltransferase